MRPVAATLLLGLLVAGCDSPEDGWLDPNSVLQGFRRQSGAEFIRERVVDVYVRGHRVHEVELASGARLAADAFVNAAGCWAPSIAKLAGMDLPVNPMRRFEHYVELAEALPPMPLIKDPERLVIRPEGKGYSVGLVNSHEPRGFNFDVETESAERVRLELDAQGPAVAMQGLGYGGYADGLGLGVWRGVRHLETEIWDVSHPAEVRYPDGRTDRPVHRIQPVAVTQHGPGGRISRGTGSLTFIAEGPLDAIGLTG